MSDDRFADYRRGIDTGVMKSATPNAMRECLNEIERLMAELDSRDRREQRLIAWMLNECGEGEDGCITGDCPHGYISDCVDHLRKRFESEVRDE